jgi:hypothetical protein
MAEGLQLTADDLSDTFANLCTNSFSGYLQMELPQSKKGYLFLSRGELLRAFECDSTGASKLYTGERLLAKAGSEGVPCSSYVLSGEMANLVAWPTGLEASQDWQAKFQGEKHSGWAFFGEHAVLFDAGEPVQASLAQNYGQVVCGREWVHKLLLQKSTQVFSQQKSLLEESARRLHRDLNRTREVKLKSVSGFFATKDALKVDSETAQEWGLKGSVVCVVEDLNGRSLGTLKTQVGSKKHLVLEIPLKVMQEWGLSEDQSVMIYPQQAD